jgi:hypothetical protein
MGLGALVFLVRIDFCNSWIFLYLFHLSNLDDDATECLNIGCYQAVRADSHLYEGQIHIYEANELSNAGKSRTALSLFFLGSVLGYILGTRKTCC